MFFALFLWCYLKEAFTVHLLLIRRRPLLETTVVYCVSLVINNSSVFVAYIESQKSTVASLVLLYRLNRYPIDCDFTGNEAVFSPFHFKQKPLKLHTVSVSVFFVCTSCVCHWPKTLGTRLNWAKQSPTPCVSVFRLVNTFLLTVL